LCTRCAMATSLHFQLMFLDSTAEVVAEEDINEWKPKSDDLEIPAGTSAEETTESSISSKHEVVCPICINDIEVGNHVVTLTHCDHKFHKDCLSQWLSTHSRDCPYCRTEIISQEMLEEAYQLRRIIEVEDGGIIRPV
jgi:Ring finger domain